MRFNIREAVRTSEIKKIGRSLTKLARSDRQAKGVIDQISNGKIPSKKEIEKLDDESRDEIFMRFAEVLGPDDTMKLFDIKELDLEESINLQEMVTMAQLKALEVFADRLLDKFGVDIEFTRHFIDRLNDPRNRPAISVDELRQLFIKIAQKQAKRIKARPDSEAVIKDIQTDLNLPVVIKFDRRNGEFDVVNKTIMRKKKFMTRDRVIRYEDVNKPKGASMKRFSLFRKHIDERIDPLLGPIRFKVYKDGKYLGHAVDSDPVDAAKKVLKSNSQDIKGIKKYSDLKKNKIKVVSEENINEVKNYKVYLKGKLIGKGVGKDEVGAAKSAVHSQIRNMHGPQKADFKKIESMLKTTADLKKYQIKVVSEETINEKLSASDPLEKWIKDFVDSDDKRFEGKSKEERIEMAKGAYYAATKDAKESVELDEVRQYVDPHWDSWSSSAGLRYGLKKGYEPVAAVGTSALNDMVLFELKPFDKKVVRNVRTRMGEEIYRYASDGTTGGDIMPLIKVNLDKGLGYFLSQESSSGETDEIIFETKPVKFKYVRRLGNEETDMKLDFGKYLKEREDYDDEDGEVPGEQDTGPDEYDDDDDKKKKSKKKDVKEEKDEDDDKELDDVKKKALKKKFSKRKDKDIDNDGDVDDSDEYLHKRRKAISKNMKKEEVDLKDMKGLSFKVYNKDTEKESEYDGIAKLRAAGINLSPEDLQRLSNGKVINKGKLSITPNEKVEK